MGVFTPHLEILPDSQQKLWPQLQGLATLGFVLYGGTAIALHLGHRVSVDFDFFTEKPLDKNSIRHAFELATGATTLQEQENTWVLLVPVNDTEQVKVSFFGGIGFGRVGTPDFTEDNTMIVAALDDLMATKLKVILQRSEAKDYRDIAAMLDAQINLSHALAAARLMFGLNFQPSESLKALAYFGDGDLHTLTEHETSTLVAAAAAVRDLPDVKLKAATLS